MASVEVRTINLNDINLNPDNPRRISEKAMERLVKSLKEFPDMMGIREIVVDETMTVLGGNMRMLALRKSGATEALVKIVSGLSPERKREFVIKDNSSFGEWDFDLLANDWSDLPLVDWGLDLPEEWLEDPKADGDADAEPQIDRAEELNKQWNIKTGDLWLIGEHRLLCGDSTKGEDVARLLQAEKPLLMVTDPPYWVEYDANWRNEADRANGKPYGARAIGKVQNDDRADWGEAYSLFPGNVAYVWHPAGATQGVFLSSLANSGFDVRMTIIWAKNMFPIGRGHYHVQHEPCFYAVRKGKTGHWIGDRKQTTLWQIDKPTKSETGHSTQKPLECMARPIRNHEAPEIYDPFLGSGTTMVAAQNLSRKCYGIEISPSYCAVILQRMADAFPAIEIRRVE